MDSTASYKLLIVDNDPFIAEELSEFFSSQGYPCIGCQSAREAIQRFRQDPDIDIVLTDLHMPDMDGIQLIQALHEDSRQGRLFESILFTGNSDKQDIILALRTGISDYYQKPLDLAEVLKGIRRLGEELDRRRQASDLNSIQQRLQSLSSSLEELCLDINKIQQKQQHKSQQPRTTKLLPGSDFEKLSPRQLEVALLIVRGLTNYQISCELGISENTVKLYVSQILRITNMHNRTQLALALMPNSIAG